MRSVCSWPNAHITASNRISRELVIAQSLPPSVLAPSDTHYHRPAIILIRSGRSTLTGWTGFPANEAVGQRRNGCRKTAIVNANHYAKVFLRVLQKLHFYVVRFRAEFNLVRSGWIAQLGKRPFAGHGSPTLYFGIENLPPLFSSTLVHLLVAYLNPQTAADAHNQPALTDPPQSPALLLSPADTPAPQRPRPRLPCPAT